MGKVYFIFGVHNHQPVGNFDHVFQEAYQRCYSPFLRTLEQFPAVTCAIHNSGPLYDWFLKSAPEYLEILKKLAKRGQVEIISGGYYEPILPLISDEDKQSQIKLMNEFIVKEFKQKAAGIWVAERVWEQYLARTIRGAGLSYTFLDDTHFRYAGLEQREFFGRYTTEDDGQSISVFPISRSLRYKIPFSKAEEAIELLHSFASEADVLVTIFDDGEKFGLWPNTYEWVYQKEWLTQFFSMLSSSQIIEMITPRQALERFASKGLVYLPTASYEEMGEWVLGPKPWRDYNALTTMLKTNNTYDIYNPFVRGGYFRNFYHKYSRLNYMHKRMLSVSRQLHADKAPLEAKKSLWKAQTNCGYWHGIFGGFYLSHIREAVYANLIRAQNCVDKLGGFAAPIHTEDIDLDGNDEIIVKNKHLICCLSSTGGTILELSLRDQAFNLCNTITRQEESYHAKIREHVNESGERASIHEVIVQKEKDLDKFLVYDAYERHSLVDHVIDKNFSLDDFNYQRNMRTLSHDLYDVIAKQAKTSSGVRFRHKAEGLDFSKNIKFTAVPGFSATYTFSKKNALNNRFFGVEFNLSLPSLNDIYAQYVGHAVSLKEPREHGEHSSFVIVDYHKKIKLVFSCSQARVMTMPVYSVSSSESGFERVYQEISVLFIVKKKDSFTLSFFVESSEEEG
ncbi:MAG: alpha-amylase/4-alpha-glucanotransferase domain-containing protein [Candidatus Omnitrophota bacterium]